jgi:hypothetical protein
MNPSDFLTMLRMLRHFTSSASPIIALLRGPLFTVILLITLLMAIMAIREGGLQPAIQVLLTDSHTSDTMQRELHSVARRDAVIDGLLKAVLAKTPSAARVRLAIIHNGEMGLTGVGLLRFDITHAIARQGFSVGAFVINGPLSDWNRYLEALLGGKCSAADLEGMGGAEHAQMVELGVSERLACPVLDIQGRLLGGLFVTWPTDLTAPEGTEMADLEVFAQGIAAQIAAALLVVGDDGPHS